MTKRQVAEISRHDSDNGYVYEYDESLASVKEIQRAHQQRLSLWRASVDADIDVKPDATAA
jgi:hypothetical protein